MCKESSTPSTALQTIIYLHCLHQTPDPTGQSNGVASQVAVMQLWFLLPHLCQEAATVGPHLETYQTHQRQSDHSMHHPPTATRTWLLRVLSHTTNQP